MPYTIAEIRNVLVFGGLVLCFYSLLLMYHTIKPNYLFGFIRTHSVVSNSEHWYLANAYVARRVFVISGLTILISILAANFSAITVNIYAIICVGFVLVSSIFLWRSVLTYLKSLT
jgi:hypothetical protein